MLERGRAPQLLAIPPSEGPIDVHSLVAVAIELGTSGVAFAVLLRDHSASLGDWRAGRSRASALQQACAQAGVDTILGCHFEEIDDVAEVIDDLRCQGIQLRGGPSSSQLARARERCPEACLGRSVHGVPDPADDALSGLVDYTVVAPIFAPRNPAGAGKPPLGLEGLRAWCRARPEPIVALGGMTPARAREATAAGARGIAGIHLFFGENPHLREDARAIAQLLGPDGRPPGPTRVL